MVRKGLLKILKEDNIIELAKIIGFDQSFSIDDYLRMKRVLLITTRYNSFNCLHFILCTYHLSNFVLLEKDFPSLYKVIDERYFSFLENKTDNEICDFYYKSINEDTDTFTNLKLTSGLNLFDLKSHEKIYRTVSKFYKDVLIDRFVIEPRKAISIIGEKIEDTESFESSFKSLCYYGYHNPYISKELAYSAYVKSNHPLLKIAMENNFIYSSEDSLTFDIKWALADEKFIDYVRNNFSKFLKEKELKYRHDPAAKPFKVNRVDIQSILVGYLIQGYKLWNGFLGVDKTSINNYALMVYSHAIIYKSEAIKDLFLRALCSREPMQEIMQLHKGLRQVRHIP